MTNSSKKIIKDITSEYEKVENDLYNRFSKIKTKTDLIVFQNITFSEFNNLIHTILRHFKKINFDDRDDINEIYSITEEKMKQLNITYTKLYHDAKNRLNLIK